MPVSVIDIRIKLTPTANPYHNAAKNNKSMYGNIEKIHPTENPIKGPPLILPDLEE